MMVYPRYVVTGTDTDVGKTVFCAALVGALGAFYWKPVQAGTDLLGGQTGAPDRIAAPDAIAEAPEPCEDEYGTGDSDQNQ